MITRRGALQRLAKWRTGGLQRSRLEVLQRVRERHRIQLEQKMEANGAGSYVPAQHITLWTVTASQHFRLHLELPGESRAGADAGPPRSGP